MVLCKLCTLYNVHIAFYESFQSISFCCGYFLCGFIERKIENTVIRSFGFGFQKP